jgi:hypothetical protein
MAEPQPTPTPEGLSLAALQSRLADLEVLVDKQAGLIAAFADNVDQKRLAEIEAVLLTVSAIAMVLHDHSARSSIEPNQRELLIRLEPLQNRVQRAADAMMAAQAQQRKPKPE